MRRKGRNHKRPMMDKKTVPVATKMTNCQLLRQDPDIPVVGYAVVLHGASPAWDYAVRGNYTKTDGDYWQRDQPSTEVVLDDFLKEPDELPESQDGTGIPIFQFSRMYSVSNALAVQQMVDAFIFDQEGVGAAPPTVRLAPFPSRAYETSGFWESVSFVFAFFMVLAMLYPMLNMIKALVQEKELRLKEGMRMMGLSGPAHVLSWWCHFVIFFLALSILLSMVTAPLFEYSDSSLIFWYFMWFFASCVSFAFFISSFFNKARTASILGTLGFLISLFPYFAVSGSSTSLAAKRGASLLPATAFALGTDAFTAYEDAQIGVTAETAGSSTDNSLPFNDAVGLLFADAVLYGLLAWYFNQVMPSEWGTQRPWYFLVTKSYWCPGLAGRQAFQDADALLAKDESEGNPNVQKVSGDLHAQLAEGSCVALRGLLKVFATPTGPKKAVHDLGLTMYRGQITALLGHNGAGKTTTISMLTGLLAPTGGAAFIQGRDVFTQMKFIRRTLGVCPQHDILYPDLTVREHLRMYAVFKGVPRAALKGAVEKMIVEVGLTEKRNKKAKSLSGGQKRKLSVGIAFIGDSKVVFLDEPTSGMDPYSRRFTWDVIRRNREGRVIVLTTHFMDEADLLGDRVAIVGEGRLRCCGSSLFLKSRFGAGYNLTLVKQFEREKEVESKEEASPAPEARIPPHNTSPATCNKDKEILDLVAHHVGGAKLLSNVGAEMSFQLPQESSKNFPSLFFELDERLPDLGIGTYGVSVTTLEEVFLRVAEGKFDEEIQKTMRENSMSIASIDAANQDLWKLDDSWKKDRIKGMGLFLMNLTILFKKRFWNYKRDRKAWVFTFISPAVFIFAGLLVLQATSSWVKPSLKLEISALFNRNTRKEPTQPVLYADSCFVQNGTLCSADIENLMSGISDIDAMQCDFSWFDADYKFAAVNSTSDSYEQDSSSILDFQNYLNARGSEEIYTMNSYLLDTKNDQDASRYGAVYFEDTSSSSTLVDYKITLLTNFTGLHAAPAFLNVVNEALIQKVLGDHEISITVRSFPLDLTQFELSQKQGIDGFTVTIFILFAFAFVPAGFAQYVVHEKEMKIKYQQVVSGVNLNAYWLSSWIWDSFQYLAGPMALCIAMLYIFDVEILVGNAVDATLTLFILFGLAVVPFTYICSFFFNSAPVAQNLSILMNWIFGLLLMCTTFIMSLIPSTQGDAVLLRRAFRVFPQYCFADALLRVSFRDFLYFFDSAVPRDPSPWHPEVAGLDIAWLGGEVLAYGLLLLAAERAAAGSSPLARRVAAARLRAGRYQPTRVDPSEVDPDVQEEQARVEAGGPHGDVIRVHGLRKAFPSRGGFKEAVRGLTLGVPRGECFGLLGINGAGKSTTMSILTGEQPPTSGRGELAGMDVTADAERVHQLVGYCPQFDAIFPLLTGRENLRIYGRIKGIPARLLEPLVERTIRQLRLDAYADRLAAGYSGGNKRKLSVGVAIIGAPELIFLDEPSTGMDPVVRRYLWDVVTKISTEWAQCAMVLTTHSMEEAEALCTRIGIMVGGRLRCLGSGQHLKSRFGLGFQLEFGLELPTEDEVHKIFSASSVLGAKEVVPESDLWATMKSLLGIEEETAKQDWLGKFSASGSASALHHELVAHGHIQAQSLVSWLLLEQRCIAAHSFVERFFEHSVLRERQGPKFRFEYPVQDKPLGRMFAILEENKASLKIKEYSLSQTSLEQIFNHFANQQEEEKGKVAGLVQHHPEENGVLSGGTSSSQQLHASSSKHTSVVAPS
uniref:ABC transporter domain-containing protein n=1 Tax=Heterosigma akashiwo TaxID=2829 RepID=A0A7S3XYS2_HETAK